MFRCVFFVWCPSRSSRIALPLHSSLGDYVDQHAPRYQKNAAWSSEFEFACLDCDRIWSCSAQEDPIETAQEPDEYRQLAEHFRSKRFWEMEIQLDFKRGPEDEPPFQKIYTMAGKNVVADDVVKRVAEIRSHFWENSIGSDTKFPSPGMLRVVKPFDYNFPLIESV